jgi:membrane protein
MKLNLKKTMNLFKTAFLKWKEKDPINESSIVAYCAIFSLPGLLVVIMKLAGYFFEKDVVGTHLHAQIADALGTNTADQIQDMIVTANHQKGNILATIIGIFTIILGACGVFVQLQKSLNRIWEVKAEPTKSGIWNYLKIRLFSFGLIISICFLMLISLVLTTVLAAAGNWVKAHWPDYLLYLFHAINFLFSLATITILFALMFKILPDAKVKWRFVWVGAFLTALLFVIAKSLLGLYFGKANPGSGYGAGGSIILILLWTSYTSMIVFYGAEFTKCYAEKDTGSVPPTEVAVKDKEAKCENDKAKEKAKKD